VLQVSACRLTPDVHAFLSLTPLNTTLPVVRTQYGWCAPGLVGDGVLASSDFPAEFSRGDTCDVDAMKECA
jgi:hypothetical protein